MLEEIIELCLEELDNQDGDIHATLDKEDLRELRDLLAKKEALEIDLEMVIAKNNELHDKLDYKDYCLDNIYALGFDYDGCEVEGCKPVDYLKELIDELVDAAKKGLACNLDDEEVKEVLTWIKNGKHSEGAIEKLFDKDGDHIPRID